MTGTSSSAPCLYLVATPIGNLGDLSPRAREVLGRVSLVLCEDTRHSSKLLAHAGIHVKMMSLHEHNEREKSGTILEQIRTLVPPEAAVISDAGTPCVSDPGAHFVRAAREAGFSIVSIPGPSALPAALAASGFAAPRHIFSAFLPREKRGQEEEFARWRQIAPCIGIFYESPQRLLETLSHLEQFFGDKAEVCISREISKIHEEHLVGTAASLLAVLQARDRIQGECVVQVLIQEAAPAPARMTRDEAVREALARKERGERLKDVAKELAQRHALDAKEIYKLAVDRGG